MNHPAEHWIKSAEGKLGEVQATFRNLLEKYPRIGESNTQAQFEKTIVTLREKTRALIDHYGPSHIPPALSKFSGSLEQWVSNRSTSDYFITLIRTFEALPSILKYSSDKELTYSEALEEQKNDPELEASVTALIAKLEELLSNADDELSGKVERDLERILQQLRKWKEKHLIDLVPWIDYAGKVAALLANVKTGTVVYPLAFELVKLAGKAHFQLQSIFDRAQGEFVLRLKMPFLAKAQEQFPRLPSSEDLPKLPGSASQS